MAELVALDTSVIVAAILAWHEHHQLARAALDGALSAPPVVLPAPALIEAYSVMTRLPSPHRVAPAVALQALESTLRRHSKVVALGSNRGWPLLESAAAAGVAGGRTYDLHILSCAKKAGARRLLTLNGNDFVALAGDTMDIAVPA